MPPDWSAHVATRVEATTDAQLEVHARVLSVSIEALRALSCFVSPRYPGAICAPMFDADRKAHGVRLRYLDGRKLAVPGSRDGVFLPEHTPASGTLLIAEGFSDTAAGLDHAPDLAWLGRPSCTGAAELALRIVRTRRPVRVVLCADADERGRHGAATLGARLRLQCADVRIVTPPAPTKDLRAWLVAGGSRADLLATIEAAPAIPAPRFEVTR